MSMNMPTDTSTLKTAKQESSVGLPVHSKLEKTSNLAMMTGETRLAGDLSEMMIPASLGQRAPVVNADALDTRDVAAWSQAFAQNDIKSLELQASAPLAAHVLQAALPSEDVLAPMPVKARESAMTSSKADTLAAGFAKANPEVVEAPAFQAWQPVKAEASESATPVVEFAVKPRQEKSKSFGDEASAGADFLLDRQIATTTALPSGESSALKSAQTLGLNADSRLSADSVKMLADKIDTLKAQGSTTLRVVVSPDNVGRIEIRVQKIGGELKVQLNSDSPLVSKALEDSKAELMNSLALRTKIASVDVGMEIQKTSGQDSIASLSLKNALPSADVLKIGGYEAKLSSSNMDFSGNPSKFSQNPSGEQAQNFDREDTRDRGMRSWQNVFEGKQSA